MTRRTARTRQTTTIKQAAIYVRVSSERQADRVSPQAQEAECRAYCESKGYVAADVYRDIERYRVGKRLVEPSGIRSDRPQLKRMLADAHADKFDVIIAWREDRLYRSYRPMLDVLDCLEQNDIDIELVKETFDRRLAPVKAWAARMELDAKHDRFVMGVAGRLAQGKTWNATPPYGYRKENDYYAVEPAEAGWVVKIFQWYAEGENVHEIRRRLIAQGAKQRWGGKRTWSIHFIRHVLRETYYSNGKHPIRWNDETFDIPIPPIIDAGLAGRVVQRLKDYKTYPAGNLKNDCLAAGLVYCKACDRLMAVNSTGARRKSGKKAPFVNYRCRSYQIREEGDGCARHISAKRLDTMLWEKVGPLLSEPGKFESAIQAQIEALQAQEIDAGAECERLEKRLDDLVEEQQWVITQGRTKRITQDQMDMQLAALAIEQAGLERELNEKRLLTGNRGEQLLELARLYRERFVFGAGNINAEPRTPEEARLQFEFRRKIVQAIVKRVEVDGDKQIAVNTEIDLFPADNISYASACCLSERGML